MNSQKYNFFINFIFLFFIIPTFSTTFFINSFYAKKCVQETNLPDSQTEDKEENKIKEVPFPHIFSFGNLFWTLGVSIEAYSAYSQEPNPNNKTKECLWVASKQGATKLIFESGKYYAKKYSGYQEIIECSDKSHETCLLAQKIINAIANHVVYIAIQAYIVNPATNELRQHIQI